MKAILSVDDSKAYLQNADTNAYLEGRFDGLNYKIENIPTPDVSGQINTHNNDTSAHADIRTAVSNAQTAANNAASEASAAQTTANSKAPMYTYGTEDLEAGVTALESGKLHFVYE